MLIFASGLVLLFIINAVLSDGDADDDGPPDGGMMTPIMVPTN